MFVTLISVFPLSNLFDTVEHFREFVFSIIHKIYYYGMLPFGMHNNQKLGKEIKSDKTLFTIIEQLKQSNGAGVTELAKDLNISKSTVHGHLMSLQNRGFIVKDDEEYCLGMEFFRYGHYVRSKTNISHAGRTAVDKLEKETDEMAWLLTQEKGNAIYIYGRGGNNDIDIDTILGKWVDMHCNSGGKAILAHLPQKRMDQIIEQSGLPQKTNNTITSRKALNKECAQIREQGYALNISEDFKGIHAVSVPLLLEGKIQGALSVAGPAHRLPLERLEGEVLNQLRVVTDEIELNLVFQ